MPLACTADKSSQPSQAAESLDRAADTYMSDSMTAHLIILGRIELSVNTVIRCSRAGRS